MNKNIDQILNDLSNQNDGPIYASWTYSVIVPSFLDVFSQSDSIAFDTRFFWQTPDEAVKIAAFGEVETLLQPTKDRLIDFQQRINERFVNQSEHESIIVGAFPFDEMLRNDETWGAFGEGFFFLPQIVFIEKKQQAKMILTIKIDQDTDKQVLKKLYSQANKLLEIPRNDHHVSTNVVSETQEVAVSEWLASVERTVTELKENDLLKKVVLARQLKATTKETIRPSIVLNNLAQQQPHTYLFALQKANQTFIGATPERLLNADADVFATAAIAGSIPRGISSFEDEQLGNTLLKDEKNTYEHRLVVERLEKSLQPIIIGDVIKSQRELLKNRDIQHLYQRLSGKRRANISFVEAVLSLHPTPALGGEPKALAKNWIRDFEPGNRGLYGAPIGWLDIITDSGEFAVGIRSALLEDKAAILYAGCGIVRDSVAKAEQQETFVKWQPMLRGIGGKQDDKSTSTN